MKGRGKPKDLRKERGKLENLAGREEEDIKCDYYKCNANANTARYPRWGQYNLTHLLVIVWRATGVYLLMLT